MTQEPDVAPDVFVVNPVVTVFEGEIATNSGSVNDPNGEPVTLSSTIGTVSKNGGNWSWEYQTTDPADTGVVAIVAEDGDGTMGRRTFTLRVRYSRPMLEVDSESVTVSPGETATNSGTVSFPSTGTVASLSTSLGSISLTDGSWTWEYTPSDSGVEGRTVAVTAEDVDGNVDQVAFDLTVSDGDAPSGGDETSITVADFYDVTDRVAGDEIEIPDAQRRRINEALRAINPDLYGGFDDF